MDTQEKQNLELVIKELGLAVESEFVPFSKSRNASNGEKFPTLNWKITLLKNDKKILTTDYSAGCAHCPSYQQRETIDSHEQVKRECETGFQWFTGSLGSLPSKKKILPDTKDVIYSLLLDSEVIDYGSFEEWASNFGYDEDSRSAEKTYNACMKIALQFNRLGESAISQLREAFQDY